MTVASRAVVARFASNDAVIHDRRVRLLSETNRWECC